MLTEQQSNQEQTTLWNGLAGRAWVEAQVALDQALRPLEDLLVKKVAEGPGGRLLDVGCGTGGTTLAIARQLEAKGSHTGIDKRGCTGIDISEVMIAAARARAEREGTPADFVRADAQTHPFEPGSFDVIVSRFGVMFFDDFVAAFTNLRRAAANGAALHFVAWRSAAENPFMTTAERAAAPLLANIPARHPDAPGQFAFADRNRVQNILQSSGWLDVDIRSIDAVCTFPEQELIKYFTLLGPLGRVLHESDDHTRQKVIETVRAAFEPYVQGDTVRFTAACWKVSARAQNP